MKNRFLAYILNSAILLTLTIPAFTQTVYELNKKLDTVIIGSNLALEATNTLISQYGLKRKWDNNVSDKDLVNSFDRRFMYPYDGDINNLSNITVGAATSIPFLLTGITVYKYAGKSEVITDAVICAETMAYTHSAGHFIKNTFSRRRPYMYYDSLAPEDRLTSDEWTVSFLSAHTAMAFAAATSTSCMFTQYDTDPLHRAAYFSSVYSMAIATGYLRIRAGDHFLSDVIAGAALGSFTGFIIPYLHKQKMPDIHFELLTDGFAVKKYW